MTHQESETHALPRETHAFPVAVLALFFAVRFVLLVVREPFFDELFSVWMARKPFAQIVPALRLDSGPPLYYFVARFADVIALRALSLVFATATLILILTRKSLREVKWTAALLLAVYPPAALFAVDARAYALCGLFVAIGSIALFERKPFVAAMAFLIGAYVHWYGALLLPLVLLAKPRRRAVLAAALAGVLFLPGLWLASRQPAEATAWLEQQSPLAPLNAFAFAGRYAESLFAPAPLAIVIVSALALVVAGARRSIFGPIVLIPLALTIAFAAAGRTVYFPMRFESVIAAPLALWLATALQRWPRELRVTVTAILCACGLIAIVIGARDHMQRPIDDYRNAALVLTRVARQHETVVATGYLYLVTAVEAHPQDLRAYPAEQARHPGWRVRHLTREPLPEGSFVWIGERAAPELAAIRQRQATVLYMNDRAIILRVAAFHT